MARLCELAQADADVNVLGDVDVDITGFATTIDEACPGTLFAALDRRAEETDVAAAVERGAVAVLAARPLDAGVPVVVSPAPLRSLARLAAAFHRHPSESLEVVGITGTDGKTTTALFTDAILRASGRTVATISTLGTIEDGRGVTNRNRLTTPEAPVVQDVLRRAVDAGRTSVVVEASSHGLALSRLDEVRFSIAAVTNVSHEHLDFHGSPERYRAAKGLLFECAARAGGVGVINGGDAGAQRMFDHLGSGRAVSYAIGDPSADVRAVDVRTSLAGSHFVLELPGSVSVPVRLRLPGRFNVENALCAAAIGYALEIDATTVARGLAALTAVPGRMEVLQRQPFTVVVDYAHTAVALEQVLSLLRNAHRRGRLLVVIGSAGRRDLVKRSWLGNVVARLADYGVFTVEDPRDEPPEAPLEHLAMGAIAAGGRDGETFARIVDRRMAIRHALDRARPGDCVVLAGKGHEASIEWDTWDQPWDEAAVVRELLGELRGSTS